MPCPYCGFILGPFDQRCSRCKMPASPAGQPPSASDVPEDASPVNASPSLANDVAPQKPLHAEPMPHLKRAGQHELYFCRRCGAANSPADRACEICGETIGYNTMGEAFRDPGVRRATMESTVILAVLLLCLQIFTHLSNLVQGCLVLSTTIVLAWRFLRALEGRRG